MEISVTKSKIFNQLVLLLIVSTGLQNVLFLSHIGNKIQFTEIIFPITLLLFPLLYYKQLAFSKSEKIFLLLLLSYLFINFLSSFLSSSNSSLLESFGRVYLAVFFMMLFFYFANMSPTEMSTVIPRIFFFLGWSLSLLSLSGYVLLWLGIQNKFVYSFSEYPYLGTIYRLNGPTFTPSMLVTILSVCFIFSVNGFSVLPYKKWVRVLLLLFIVVACFLTFSKTLLLIFWGTFVISYSRYNKLNKKIIIVTLLPVILFLFLATHFVLAKPNTEQYNGYIKTNFISSEAAFKIGKIEALETCYYLNKRIAVEVALKHPLLGIGAGNFNDEVEKRKSENKYPSNFLSYDPHSTYFGALAENGFLGFAALMILLGFLLLAYSDTKLINSNSFYQSIFILLVIFYCEAISTDIMNFRHLWVLFAIAFGYRHKLRF